MVDPNMQYNVAELLQLFPESSRRHHQVSVAAALSSWGAARSWQQLGALTTPFDPKGEMHQALKEARQGLGQGIGEEDVNLEEEIGEGWWVGGGSESGGWWRAATV